MGVMERDELEERWGSAEEDGGERSVVVVSVTEMRVGDQREPLFGHAFEAEEWLDWDSDEDLCHEILIACNRFR